MEHIEKLADALNVEITNDYRLNATDMEISEWNTADSYEVFVITKDSKAISTVKDGDSVIFFNFRGDRAIEISQAFEQENFHAFNRKRKPKIYYAGMTQYD